MPRHIPPTSRPPPTKTTQPPTRPEDALPHLRRSRPHRRTAIPTLRRIPTIPPTLPPPSDDAAAHPAHSPIPSDDVIAPQPTAARIPPKPPPRPISRPPAAPSMPLLRRDATRLFLYMSAIARITCTAAMTRPPSSKSIRCRPLSCPPTPALPQRRYASATPSHPIKPPPPAPLPFPRRSTPLRRVAAMYASPNAAADSHLARPILNATFPAGTSSYHVTRPLVVSSSFTCFRLHPEPYASPALLISPRISPISSPNTFHQTWHTKKAFRDRTSRRPVDGLHRAEPASCVCSLRKILPGIPGRVTAQFIATPSSLCLAEPATRNTPTRNVLNLLSTMLDQVSDSVLTFAEAEARKSYSSEKRATPLPPPRYQNLDRRDASLIIARESHDELLPRLSPASYHRDLDSSRTLYYFFYSCYLYGPTSIRRSLKLHQGGGSKVNPVPAIPPRNAPLFSLSGRSIQVYARYSRVSHRVRFDQLSMKYRAESLCAPLSLNYATLDLGFISDVLHRVYPPSCTIIAQAFSMSALALNAATNAHVKPAIYAHSTGMARIDQISPLQLSGVTGAITRSTPSRNYFGVFLLVCSDTFARLFGRAIGCSTPRGKVLSLPLRDFKLILEVTAPSNSQVVNVAPGLFI
ncbi:hypothetical protein B0H11DRAFT_1933659 [Mycena galericulata]|nr:hypothetical protein B0H11DRAFT_1933659 [Mycena galericulata]